MNEKRTINSSGEASSLGMLKKHITSILSQLYSDFCQRLFNVLRTKIQIAADNGVLSVVCSLNSI